MSSGLSIEPLSLLASRLRRAVLPLVAGLVALLLFGEFWVLPHWRPTLGPGESYGVDVSRHQGQIDWALVASDDIQFAYIKATEGRDWLDPMFAENWSQAAEAGLQRGAYHFFTLCSDASEQARWFLANAPPDPGALRPAVDLELAGNCSHRPWPYQLTSELSAFLAIVEEAWGRPAVLYIGNGWDQHYGTIETTDRPLWLRRPLIKPSQRGWVIWQLHGYANVAGVVGGVDINVGRLEHLID